MGIDPETVRLVAQCLNHYATQAPTLKSTFGKFYRESESSYCFAVDIINANLISEYLRSRNKIT